MDPTPEVATEAFLAGKRAGNLLLAPGLNPFNDQADPAQHADWQRGMNAAFAEHARYANAQIARERLKGYPDMMDGWLERIERWAR